jgi:hypothetical protein
MFRHLPDLSGELLSIEVIKVFRKHALSLSERPPFLMSRKAHRCDFVSGLCGVQRVQSQETMWKLSVQRQMRLG